MHNFIVVVGTQRSGTTVLRNILQIAGGRDLGEIFHAQFENKLSNFFYTVERNSQANKMLIHPSTFPKQFREYLVKMLNEHRHKPVIVDIKYNALGFIDGGMSLDIPASLRILSEQPVHFVQVMRRNKLRCLISLRIAEKTGIWRYQNDQNLTLSDKRVSINPSDVVNTLSLMEKQDQTVSRWLKTCGRTDIIVYEELFKSDGTFSAQTNELITQFATNANQDNIHSRVELKKQNRELIADLVINFDEIVGALTSTPFEWMLEK